MNPITVHLGRSLLVSVVVCMLGVVSAQEVEGPASPAGTNPVDTQGAPSQTAKPTEAENIVALQRLVEMDRERLAKLESDSGDIAKEFDRLSLELGQLDEDLVGARSRLDDARRERAASRATELEAEVARSQVQREEIRKEFDLVIERRKAIDRQLSILPAKVKLEQQALHRLMQPNAAAQTTPAAGKSQSDAYLPADIQRLTRPQGEPAQASADSANEAGGPQPSTAEPVYDPVVADARKALRLAELELQEAEERVQLLDRGLDLFQADLDITRDLLTSERRKAEAAQEARGRLNERLNALLAEGAPAADVARVKTEIQESESRIDLAQRNVSRYADRLDLITVQVEQLQQSYGESVKALDALRSQAEQAREQLAFSQSPLAPHRLTRWMMREGVVIVVVLVLMGLLWMLAQVVARRVVMALARRGHRGSDLEREERAQTLKRVFQSVTAIVITTIGGIAILDQVGIDVTVLLGGAAVFGMAVAFGAQALVKDYFSGFIMLMENQYRVGNVVRIGEIAGAVEDVTLRMTVLRDLEGVAHFIPHGQIATVSNLTHGWSRVVFDIGVGYGEDVDHVMKVLVGLASDLRQDPEFGHLILDEPEMLGVDAFEDSAVVVKFMIKTRPLRQWAVKRELLRRIKHEFDAQGIEIPFPHRTVYHREFSEELAVRIEDRQAAPPPPSAAQAVADQN